MSEVPLEVPGVVDSRGSVIMTGMLSAPRAGLHPAVFRDGHQTMQFSDMATHQLNTRNAEDVVPHLAKERTHYRCTSLVRNCPPHSTLQQDYA